VNQKSNSQTDAIEKLMGPLQHTGYCHNPDLIEQARAQLAALKAENEKIKRWLFVCEDHAWPFGAEDDTGPICPWCERIAKEGTERERDKLKASNDHFIKDNMRLFLLVEMMKDGKVE
jgi:hypothetical protein